MMIPSVSCTLSVETRMYHMCKCCCAHKQDKFSMMTNQARP